MKVYILILCILFSSSSFGQNLVFDTTVYARESYSKTDFSNIDTFQLWNYLLDTTYKGRETDSIKPSGQLIFYRTSSIDDGISKKIYGRLWTPVISFDIFSVADTSYCFERSARTRIYSSCVPSDVGGDIIIIGKYLFLNHSVCVRCERHDTKVDYCRPVINYVFSKIDKNKITTIQSLVHQFIIAEGKPPIQQKQKGK